MYTQIRYALTALLIMVHSGAALFTVTPLRADETPSPFIHAALRAKDLPAPGNTLKLAFRPRNEGLPITRAHVIAVRDGTLIDLLLKEAPVEGKDIIAYTANIPAPLIELKYQFTVTLSGGKTITSEPFVVRRPCIPDITLVQETTEIEPQLADRLNRLLIQARGLERDLILYEKASDALEDLLSKMKE